VSPLSPRSLSSWNASHPAQQGRDDRAEHRADEDQQPDQPGGQPGGGKALIVQSRMQLLIQLSI
jgi:hypothetical protein